MQKEKNGKKEDKEIKIEQNIKNYNMQKKRREQLMTLDSLMKILIKI